ncbi:MAG: alpha-amylase family glycosyl hydrolase [Sandaracinaceae bacterium]|nr:alpha-amylase family glycosyl hydrolase [Sandaracinaceae bacterium]
MSPWEARVTFADNHDVWRLRGELDDPLAARIALTAVLTADGIPAIYYGTEQELDGTQHHLSREPLWEAGFSEETPTFRFLQALIAVRRRSRALRWRAARRALPVRERRRRRGAGRGRGDDRVRAGARG